MIVLLLVFSDCMGGNRMTDAASWLGVKFAGYIAEIVLAILILYSVTDVSQLLNFLERHFCCCWMCKSSPIMNNGSIMHNSSLQTALAQNEGGGPALRQQSDVVLDNPDTEGEGDVEKRFTPQINKESEHSYDSAEASDRVQSPSCSDAPIANQDATTARKCRQTVDQDTIGMIFSVSDRPQKPPCKTTLPSGTHSSSNIAVFHPPPRL